MGDGRPETPAGRLTRRLRRGEVLARYGVELDDVLLFEVDAEAALDQRSRVAETRVLLAEAIAARKARRR